MIDQTTTIVASATAPGGAISVIRLSGESALSITAQIFNRSLTDRVATFGTIMDHGRIVDEVVVTYYRAPRSYTGEDCVEISCHGSAWVTDEIIRLLTSAGATPATAGEFTLRAFLNGKMDLSQAEAVADMIAANSRASAAVAMTQMRGGYSDELKVMSGELLNILSLLELELDFGEEDVEFADRTTLKGLIERIAGRVAELSSSFRLGNVLKNGVQVAIVGKPNVGKSTLLNCLMGEERAIVSSIAGTTRDFIEETLVIDGICLRFIDTAGLRISADEIERIGIERSYEKLRNAAIVLLLVDTPDDAIDLNLSEDQTLIIVLNKCDNNSFETKDQIVRISAKHGTGINELKRRLLSAINISNYDSTALVVSNARHYAALEQSHVCFTHALGSITAHHSTDIIASDIRQSLSHLSEITGEITTDDILGNIFSKFCIGK